MNPWLPAAASLAGAVFAIGVTWGSLDNRIEAVEKQIIPPRQQGTVIARVTALESRLDRLHDRVVRLEKVSALAEEDW